MAVYRITLYDKIGPGPHPCHWCQTPVHWMPGQGLAPGALVVDHLDADDHNDAIENLVPSCVGCNGTRARKIQPDEDYIESARGWRTRAVRRTCATCGSEFLVPPSRLNGPRNQGTYCSTACLYKRPRAS